MAFPRFYFVSPADLLDILSKGSNPQLILRHLQKCFDNIDNLSFRCGASPRLASPRPPARRAAAGVATAAVAPLELTLLVMMPRRPLPPPPPCPRPRPHPHTQSTHPPTHPLCKSTTPPI